MLLSGVAVVVVMGHVFLSNAARGTGFNLS